jgi:hypothetical protein
MYHSFENLEVWKKTYGLVIRIYASLSGTKEYFIKDQVLRSALSIPGNIAEGAERNSKQEFIRIVDVLRSMGAEGVILGCTEIGMLIGPGDTPVTLYDTTKIHAAKAVEWALMTSE